MRTQRLQRRRVLQRAGLMGAGALAGLAPLSAQAQNAEQPHGIEGTWLILVTPQGAPPSAAYEVLNLYTVGGGVAGTSAHDPRTGGGVYGGWSKSGDHQFQITFIGFTFDLATGDWTGTLKVQARATLSRDDQTISGPARVSIYSPAGTLIGQQATSFTGTRVRVEPL